MRLKGEFAILSSCGQGYPQRHCQLYEKVMKAYVPIKEALSKKTLHFFQKTVDNVNKLVDKYGNEAYRHI